MAVTFDPKLSLEENLKANAIPTAGGKRGKKLRGGDDVDEPEMKVATRNAAITLIIGILKKGTALGRDVVLKAATAAGYTGVAAAAMYLADATFRPGLCDPLVAAISRTLIMLPPAAAFTASCDTASSTYNAVIAATALAITPLLMKALNAAGSITLEEDAVDEVRDAIINTIKNPGAAASAAMTTRSSTRALGNASGAPPPPSQWSRRGGRKSKKSKKTKKTTRRVRRSSMKMPTFAY